VKIYRNSSDFDDADDDNESDGDDDDRHLSS